MRKQKSLINNYYQVNKILIFGFFGGSPVLTLASMSMKKLVYTVIITV